MKKITAKRILLSVMGVIGLLLLAIFAVVLLYTIHDERQLRIYCNAPTETVDVDGLTTDYKRIENHRFYDSDLIDCYFGVGQLEKKVKGANLYTVSESQNVLTDLIGYGNFHSDGKIYVRVDKLKLLPGTLSEADISYISLGFSKSDEEGFKNKQFILDLTQDDIAKAISFCQNKSNLLNPPAESEKIEMVKGNNYSICCHIKGLEELFFKYPGYCVQNLNDGKYYLESYSPIDVFYEIPDKYQDIIKAALN